MDTNEAKKPIGFELELTEEQLKTVAGGTGTAPIPGYPPIRVTYKCHNDVGISGYIRCDCTVVRDYPGGTMPPPYIEYPHQFQGETGIFDCTPILIATDIIPL